MDLEEFRQLARDGITIKRCLLCTSPVAPGNELCQAHWDALLAEGDGLPCASAGCKTKATERHREKDFCGIHAAAAMEMHFCSYSDCNEKAFHMVDGMDLCDDHFDQYRINAQAAHRERMRSPMPTTRSRLSDRTCKHCNGSGADSLSVVIRCAFCNGTGVTKASV